MENDIWIASYSCCDWTSPAMWHNYLTATTGVLNANITHLDVKDPVLRKAGGRINAMAEYITRFGANTDKRWLFGKIESLNVSFSISHYKQVGEYPNSILWHIPSESMVDLIAYETIYQMFSIANDTLSCFYSFADLRGVTASKKKKHGSVDLRAELVGVFWLTYFCNAYVDYIGRDRFLLLGDACSITRDGLALRLSPKPSSLDKEARRRVESFLSDSLFSQPDDEEIKRPGTKSLNFDCLRKTFRK